MQIIVGLVYVTLLALVMTYAVGGFGLGAGIVALLVYIAVSELWKAYHLGNHPELEEHPRRRHAKVHH